MSFQYQNQKFLLILLCPVKLGLKRLPPNENEACIKMGHMLVSYFDFGHRISGATDIRKLLGNHGIRIHDFAVSITTSTYSADPY